MQDLNALPLGELFGQLVDLERLDRLIRLAVEEDLGDLGDITTASLVPESVEAKAAIVARGEGIVAGLPVVARVLSEQAPALVVAVRGKDGEACKPGDLLVELAGPLAVMLNFERIMLNLLGRLCGVATLTRRYVDAVQGTKAKLCCTRKTTPGWREIEKYAVRCGGGWLHRIGLYDAMLVKDNHLGAVPPDGLAAAIAAASKKARGAYDLRFIEVEVDTLGQFDQLLALPSGVIDIVLLDNFKLPDLVEAVRRRDASNPKLELEASGGVRLETVRAIAETGVDRISCGALTHSAVSMDVAIDLV